MSESAWGESGWRPGGQHDPWASDPFSPPTPHVPAPGPSKRKPRPIPDQHELFVVQRHALDVLHGLADLEHKLGDKKDKHTHSILRSLARDAENTYRVIRTWLKNNASGDPTTLE